LATHAIASLRELEELASSLDAECRSKKPHEHAYVSPVLFRGHSRADWTLDTTLERFGKKNLNMDEYVRYLSKVKPAVQAYTGRDFSFRYENPKTAGNAFPLSQVALLEGQYEFMVYLRHHGFPTPLLDWSRSLYVAIYFACAGPEHDEDSALYMYVENLGYGKGGCVGAPEIATLGQYISAHKRHFTQQSEYTACIAKIDENWCFHPHEAAIGSASDHQDRLEKVLIPANLRRKLLRKLDGMNINAFSLFSTEEALMQTLAFRELHEW
jgi:FRG domain